MRCHVTAYNINTGQQVWWAYSMGPDEDVRLAPDFNAANPHYGQTGLGTQSWPGESWKQGGGCAWGWYSYDPALNLLYYGTGNPGPWNPSQRQGDNKGSVNSRATMVSMVASTGQTWLMPLPSSLASA